MTTTPHDKALERACIEASTVTSYVTPERMQAAMSAYLSSIGGVVCQREPAAWGRVIAGEAIIVSRTQSIANCDPLHAPISIAGEGDDGWMEISSAPKDGSEVQVAWKAVVASGDEPQWHQAIAIWDKEFETVSWGEYRGAWTDYVVASFSHEEYRELHPTHWRPTPAPPSIGSDDREGGSHD